MPALRIWNDACEMATRGHAAALREIKRGESLYRQGDPLLALYQVHSGQFKSSHTDEGGRGQVTGFQLGGEWLGLDGIGSGRHCVDAMALQHSVVCRVPYDDLLQLLDGCAALQHQFHRILSREIVRDHDMMRLLGGRCAECRVASFLIGLQGRMQGRMQVPRPRQASLLLAMSRRDIGSYLGMQLETVSRVVSKLHRLGILDVQCREVVLLDLPALARLAQT